MKITDTSDLHEAFIKCIEQMLVGYSEGQMVFDHYLDQSVKNKALQKGAVTSTEFHIYPAMKLTMSLKEIFSASKPES